MLGVAQKRAWEFSEFILVFVPELPVSGFLVVTLLLRSPRREHWQEDKDGRGSCGA